MKSEALFPPIRINTVGQTIPSPQWRWDPGPMRDHDLVILMEGQGTYSDGESLWKVSPGSCMFFQPQESYRGVQEPMRPVAMFFVHFDFLDRKSRPVGMAGERLLPRHFQTDRFEFVQRMSWRLLEAYRRGTVEEADVWLRALILELRRQALQPRWQGIEREQAERVEALCGEIRGRIGEPWRLADISTRLGCGAEHAGRLFRKYRGVAPGEYVIQARLEAAKALLNSSSLSISQVAETLGFCDVYALSRQFKQRTGLSPRAFREQ